MIVCRCNNPDYFIAHLDLLPDQSRFDKTGLSETKAFINTSALPQDQELASGLQAFFATAGRRASYSFAPSSAAVPSNPMEANWDSRAPRPASPDLNDAQTILSKLLLNAARQSETRLLLWAANPR